MALSGSRQAAMVRAPAGGLGITVLPGPSGAAEPSGRVMVLEASDRRLDPLLVLLRPDFEVRLVHAPRRADPRRYGRPLEHGHWLVGPPEAPDPIGLGTALEALEALLLEEPGSGPDRPILIGSGAGATLALALASCWGDRLRAVFALDGVLPALPADVARAGIEGLPILRLRGGDSDGEATAGDLLRLSERGALVRSEGLPAPEAAAEAVLAWLREVVLAGDSAGREGAGQSF